ncbi:hypothetical protein [Mucilaginibacter sp.]|uniref:hypothetical protein n=1 Tax=Mucilaginibacter sp. TaxID=1882438 RepID=UPI0025F1756A|nr:hypothetical protein [Mucilaginibacter sp.]
MMKKITYLLLLVTFLSACKTDKQKNGCGLQTCTANYAYLGIRFIDKESKPVSFSNFTAVNLRTNKSLTPLQYPPNINIDFVAGFVLLASDANIKDFSTDGDDVKISATNTATSQTKTATLKIAGGCGCHVTKVSGPDKVVFD